MREILFRGKRDKRFGDGWSYGLLRKGGNYRYISNCGSCICVIPETVGQYTGLTDKNGNRIFEGDIIKGKEKATYAIGYSDATAGFYAKATLPQRILPCMNIGTMKYYEVIGNIHDNPELLEEVMQNGG